MGQGIATRHPAKEFAIIDYEVSEGELVGVEEERGDAEREDREPEVDKKWRPDRQGCIE